MTHGSGRIMGTHQKIDRVARRKLQPYLKGGAWFPRSREILRFEGLNGPDGIKRKSPARDEPRHFIDPTDPNDVALVEMIHGNQENLIQALREGNRERAAFEAAWLAHAITDGLTPAHHYPYEERLAEIRGNAGQQDNIWKKFIMPGNTVKDKFLNNWEYWKPGGLMTSHGLYELGVAFVSAPQRFADVGINSLDRAHIMRVGGIANDYLKIVRSVYDHHMYSEFLEKGWNEHLARETKNYLMPVIIHTVLSAWYYCAIAAASPARGGDSATVNNNSASPARGGDSATAESSGVTDV